MSPAAKELAYRNQNGLEVTLLWDPDSNDVSVEVVDQLDEAVFTVSVPGHAALDAFHHPFAYAHSREGQLDGVPQAASAE